MPLTTLLSRLRVGPAVTILSLPLLVFSTTAAATLGPFEHGSGIIAQGLGGVAYSMAEEAGALAANPAHASGLGARYDIGLHTFFPKAIAGFEGTTDDRSTRNDGRRTFFIPQGGMIWKLPGKWSAGFASTAAGLGPDYKQSPYERFGGARRSYLFFSSATLNTALGYALTPTQSLGIGVNLGYQKLKAGGLEFLDNPQSSVAPGHVTDRGNDGAFSIGFSLGWTGELIPGLRGGLGYRSRNWTQKHEKYRGLLPQGGRLTLPAIYGGGLSWQVHPQWTFGADYQRFDYHSGGRTFENGIGQLFNEGQRFGADDGPGFGLNNQSVYKFGASYRASPTLTLRAGYIGGTQIIRSSDTLLAQFGTFTTNTHYTLGFTKVWQAWEISAMGYDTPRQTVRGRNSLGPLGPGEASASFAVRGFGISVGRRLP
ncbi:MAG: outer membrane protein transport protein [Pseudomonadota bacterium]